MIESYEEVLPDSDYLKQVMNYKFELIELPNENFQYILNPLNLIAVILMFKVFTRQDKIISVYHFSCTSNNNINNNTSNNAKNNINNNQQNITFN